MSGNAWRTALLLSIIVGSTTHAWTQDGNFTVYDENDTFTLPGLSSDNNYTQGVRFEIPTNVTGGPLGWFDRHLGTADWFQRQLIRAKLVPNGAPYEAGNSLVVGQVIVTPDLITSYVEDRQDRPFSGFTYVASRAGVFPSTGVRTGWASQTGHVLELAVGTTGPPALAFGAQAGLHVLREHRIPKGWRHQIGTEPQLQANYTGMLRSGNSTFDIVPNVTIAMGTLQTHVSTGATVRIGHNMTGFPTAVGFMGAVLTSPPPIFEFGLFTGADARYVVHNAHLDGTLFGRNFDVEKVRGVWDFRAGAFVRHDKWRLNYTLVRRSREFEPTPPGLQGHHWFGSIAISREGPESSGTWLPPLILRDWHLVFGLGSGKVWLSPDRPAERGRGPAGEIGFYRGLGSRWAVGFIQSGVAREEGPPDADGVHADTFALVQTGTMTYWPLGRTKKPGSPYVRAGFGQGTGKREITENGIPSDDRSIRETGKAWHVGAGYGFNLGDDVTFGLAAAWNHLPDHDGSVFERANSFSAKIEAQWHLFPDRP